MKLVRSLVVLGLVVAPIAAWAADIPVSFTTKEKDLKSALAGTPLTFALYSDSGCTTQVYSTIVNVENVALITKMKQFTPKNDTKLPNTVALQTTLPGVAAHGNLYLKVTGTGIVPVAGACQAQAATVPVPTCNDGVQNQTETDVDCGGTSGCFGCQNGKNCLVASDCQSFTCMAGICQAAPPSCSDGIQNQGETDIDCGGPNCPNSCNIGQSCVINGDCHSNNCAGGNCQP
jgi:hypothetical protein